METELITQFNKLIVKSSSVAIVMPSFVTIDELCSAISLEATLKQDGKTVTILSSATKIPDVPFLPSIPKVHRTINAGDEFVIHLSNRHAEPAELRYEKDATGLQIFIRSKNGRFESSDVTTSPAVDSFDLLIILGAGTFEELGSVYTSNTSVFFNTTKIAISNRAYHDYFAAVNIVNTQSAALCEIVYDLIGANSKSFGTDVVATALLAGLIAQTQSFRDAN